MRAFTPNTVPGPVALCLICLHAASDKIFAPRTHFVCTPIPLLSHISRLTIHHQIISDYSQLSQLMHSLNIKAASMTFSYQRFSGPFFLIGNQSHPKFFDLNIRHPPPLYSTVIEIDERVTLVGYISDPQVEEHKVVFDENGQVKRGCRATGGTHAPCLSLLC